MSESTNYPRPYEYRVKNGQEIKAGSVTMPARGTVNTVVDFIVVGEKGSGKSQFIANAITALGLTPLDEDLNNKPIGYKPRLSQNEAEWNNEISRLCDGTDNVAAKATGDIKHYITRGSSDGMFRSLRAKIRIVRTAKQTRITFLLSTIAMLVFLGVGVASIGFNSMVMTGNAGIFWLGWVAVFLGLVQWVLFFFGCLKLARLNQIEVVFWDIRGGDIAGGSDAVANQLAILFGNLDSYRRTLKLNHAVAFTIVVNPLQHAAVSIGGARRAGSTFPDLCSFVQNQFRRYEKGNLGPVLIVFNRYALLKHVETMVEKQPELGEAGQTFVVYNLPISDDGSFNKSNERHVKYVVRIKSIIDCIRESHFIDERPVKVVFFEAGCVCCGQDDNLEQSFPDGYVDGDDAGAVHGKGIVYKYREQTNGFDEVEKKKLRLWMLATLNKGTRHDTTPTRQTLPLKAAETATVQTRASTNSDDAPVTSELPQVPSVGSADSTAAEGTSGNWDQF